MYPFIHIGPLTLGTYGLMVAIGLICAFFILRADFERRKVPADAEAIIGITGLAGLVGSRLYHLLQSPSEFFADPWSQLFSTMGFAFVGAIIGGFLALLLLAKRFRMSPLLMLDAASPAAAMGYGIGRIGCLLSGDGDYGVPTSLPWGMSFPNGLVPTDQRVHPTPIYELLAACFIAWILWRIGAVQIRAQHEREEALARMRAASPPTASLTADAGTAAMDRRASYVGGLGTGEVFATYLVLTGAARFLVEFIRINPRSFFGMSNAQAASLASVIGGVALWLWLSRDRGRAGNRV